MVDSSWLAVLESSPEMFAEILWVERGSAAYLGVVLPENGKELLPQQGVVLSQQLSHIIAAVNHCLQGSRPRACLAHG